MSTTTQRMCSMCHFKQPATQLVLSVMGGIEKERAACDTHTRELIDSGVTVYNVREIDE